MVVIEAVTAGGEKRTLTVVLFVAPAQGSGESLRPHRLEVRIGRLEAGLRVTVEAAGQAATTTLDNALLAGQHVDMY